MKNNTLTALASALEQYGKIAGKDSQTLTRQLTDVFRSDEAYLNKVARLDQVFDDEPAFEALREIAFDLLLINFFSEDVKKLEEDYLESPEWEAIEEKTIDRGTELLNVLLYLKECQDEQIEPELSDFLKEFLLVDEDEFQDEYRIYEEVIANQILMESPIQEVAQVAKKIAADVEIKELFYAMMCFFHNPKPSEAEQEEVLKNSPQADFDTAIYQLLIKFNQQ